MFRSISRVLVVVLALLALAGVVSADGGINGSANGFFGGDSLFCDSVRGCWLLNGNRPANGSVPVLLGEFPQADIQAALGTCVAEGHNVEIGTIQGTYGPFTLSAVYDGPNAHPICSLQVNGTEAEGKPAKPYSFAPKDDGNYDSIPAPVPAVEEETVSGGNVVPPPPPTGLCVVVLGVVGSGLPSVDGQPGHTGGWDIYTWIGSISNVTFWTWSQSISGPMPPNCP
jgi:hypothetical protein